MQARRAGAAEESIEEPQGPAFQRRPMQVHEVMSRQVETISPEATLREAARKMKDLDAGPLPVFDGRVVLGMLTDRDIVIRAIAEGLDPASTPVRDVMTEDVVSCRMDQSAEQAAQLMRESEVRRLVVLGSDDRPVGIVSLGDLATMTHDAPEVGETLEQISSAEPQR